MTSLKLVNGKYYGYDPNGGRIYDLKKIEYIKEDKKNTYKANIQKEEKNKENKPLDEKDGKEEKDN